MSTKTRSIVPTLVVIVAGAMAIAGFQFLKAPAGRNGDDRQVMFQGTWLGPSRPEGVDVEIVVGGHTVFHQVEHIAPFTKVLNNIEKGQKVEIHVTLKGKMSAKLVGCAISINGLEEVNDHRVNPANGEPLVCWAVV